MKSGLAERILRFHGSLRRDDVEFSLVFGIKHDLIEDDVVVEGGDGDALIAASFK